MIGPGVSVCFDAVLDDAVVGAGATVGYIVSLVNTLVRTLVKIMFKLTAIFLIVAIAILKLMRIWNK